MANAEQFDLFIRELGDHLRHVVVPTMPDFAWSISGTGFGDMTVTPSIDASTSGHWHGNITAGEVK